MTTSDELDLHELEVHRPSVVRSVAIRVPGAEPEEATCRALEKMVRLVAIGGTIGDPVPYWRRAAVNEAVSMAREAGRPGPAEVDTLTGLAPSRQVAELGAEREAQVSILRSALSGLADDDREILLDRHVHDLAVADIAGRLGTGLHAATVRLRRAEQRLARAYATANAQAVIERDCRTTRAAMHDYLRGHLLPRGQRCLEVHMNSCSECARVFADVREVSWMLHDMGLDLITGPSTAEPLERAGVVGGTDAMMRHRRFGPLETAVAAGVLAAVALAGSATAHLANQEGPTSVQALTDLSPHHVGAPDAMRSLASPTRSPADPVRRPTKPSGAVPIPGNDMEAGAAMDAEPVNITFTPEGPAAEPANMPAELEQKEPSGATPPRALRSAHEVRSSEVNGEAQGQPTTTPPLERSNGSRQNNRSS